ncbi:hypothetical protein GCM10009853_012810 [Glycomyces scopariae]
MGARGGEPVRVAGEARLLSGIYFLHGQVVTTYHGVSVNFPTDRTNRLTAHVLSFTHSDKHEVRCPPWRSESNTNTIHTPARLPLPSRKERRP